MRALVFVSTCTHVTMCVCRFVRLYLYFGFLRQHFYSRHFCFGICCVYFNTHCLFCMYFFLALEFDNLMFHISRCVLFLCNLLLNCILFPIPHAMLSSRCVSVCVQGILINVQKVSAKWNRNELLSSGCPLPLLLCLSVHSFIITPLTAAPWTMLRQRHRHRRVWRRRRQSSDGADQQQSSNSNRRVSLSHIHMCTHGCALSSICRSLVAILFSLSVFALSTNQTSRCFVRALYHLLLILLLLLLLLLLFASSSCSYGSKA